MINRVSMFALATSLATNIAMFTTTTHATALSRELAVESAAQRKLGSVDRAGWGRWTGWSGAGWGFVGPGGGRGWMGNGWGWRGVGPYVAPIYVSRVNCRRPVSTGRGWARSLVC
jgi:hypothetical protein